MKCSKEVLLFLSYLDFLKTNEKFYLIEKDLLNDYAYLVLEMDANLTPLELEGFTSKIYKYENCKTYSRHRILGSALCIVREWGQ